MAKGDAGLFSGILGSILLNGGLEAALAN